MAKYAFIIVLFILSSFTFDVEPSFKKNLILNESALSPFFNQLVGLDTSSEGKVSIVHIGDSHIQADLFSGEVRKKLQARFGNAGRGFVFPYKLASTSGVLDMRFKYSGNWENCSVLKGYQNCNLGVAGYSVSADQESTFTIDARSRTDSDASFDRIKFISTTGGFQPVLEEVKFDLIEDSGYTTLKFHEPQDSLTFRPITGSTRSDIQGMVLENGERGVLYNAMGVNGSSTLQYLRSANIEVQISQLDASLVILSFGTNDCYMSSNKFCVSCTKDRYVKLIERIRTRNPKVCILLTTPPDHYLYQKHSNTNIEILNKALEEICFEQNVALWDLYSSMGGKNSIISWRDNNLAARDLIHFTKEGYKLQGALLFKALMHHYKSNKDA